MRLNETIENFFTYKQVGEILKAEGLGYSRSNVSLHVSESKNLKRVTHIGDPFMITRASLEALIKQVKARGAK